MNSWEYFLINKYHPKFNVALNDSNIQLQVEEIEWIEYHKNDILVPTKPNKKNNNTIKRDREVNLQYIISENQQSKIINKEDKQLIANFKDTGLLEQELILYLIIKSKLTNTPLTETIGTFSNFIKFSDNCYSNSIYEHIHQAIDKSQILQQTTTSNTFCISNNENLLINFTTLDIELLINIFKYIKTKYTCFIIDLLLQTSDNILSTQTLYDNTPPGYKKWTDLNRILSQVIKDLQKIGFLSNYKGIQEGRKYTKVIFE